MRRLHRFVVFLLNRWDHALDVHVFVVHGTEKMIRVKLRLGNDGWLVRHHETKRRVQSQNVRVVNLKLTIINTELTE